MKQKKVCVFLCFLFFHGLSYYLFDLCGGSGDVWVHLRGRFLQTQNENNEMGAFILKSAQRDAEPRISAVRGRCRRSQGAPAARPANYNYGKTQAQGARSKAAMFASSET